MDVVAIVIVIVFGMRSKNIRNRNEKSFLTTRTYSIKCACPFYRSLLALTHQLFTSFIFTFINKLMKHINSLSMKWTAGVLGPRIPYYTRTHFHCMNTECSQFDGQSRNHEWISVKQSTEKLHFRETVGRSYMKPLAIGLGAPCITLIKMLCGFYCRYSDEHV